LRNLGLKYHIKVTIEERLEKLTERHEALTQTVEIIATMQKDNERRFAETDRRMGQVLEAITQLGHIAESHDHRLDNLEDRPR
jgi:hypothetical protein